jgi:hypothetical protein
VPEIVYAQTFKTSFSRDHSEDPPQTYQVAIAARSREDPGTILLRRQPRQHLHGWRWNQQNLLAGLRIC